MLVNSGTHRAGSLALDGGKPVRSDWLSYGRQSISPEDISAVVATLQSDWLTQGPTISKFESAIIEVCDTQYAVAFNSGTAALHAAYFAAGISTGDEIITSGMTFAATSNAAVLLGGRPRFADVSLDTGLIDLESVRSQLNSNVKAIVGIDYAGQPCDRQELFNLAKENGIPFILDAAHSIGSLYFGQPLGTHATMTTLSFHPVKAITTGEGGMVLTNSLELAEKLLLFRTHGITKEATNFINECEGPWYHEMQLLGPNYRMCDFQASLGISQLKSLDRFIQRRIEIANLYRQALSGNEYFTCLEALPNRESAHHLFPVLLKTQYTSERARCIKALHAENIGVQVHYIPTYMHPYYQDLLKAQPHCPNTDDFYSREISLPIFPAMSEGDVNDVLVALDKVAYYVLRK